MSQEDLGKVLGVSRRTVSRWSCEGTTFAPSTACTLAKLVHRKNRALAAQFASLGGTTLIALGLEAPAPSPKLLDAVVCAAADALDVSPRSVRPALLAAFRCAREAGLSVEAMEEMLTPKETAKEHAG